MAQHFVDEGDLPPKRKYPKGKRFHVDAKKEDWATWRRLASFRYQPDAEKCYLEVLSGEYETARLCRYASGKLRILESQGDDTDPTEEPIYEGRERGSRDANEESPIRVSGT